MMFINYSCDPTRSFRSSQFFQSHADKRYHIHCQHTVPDQAKQPGELKITRIFFIFLTGQDNSFELIFPQYKKL